MFFFFFLISFGTVESNLQAGARFKYEVVKFKEFKINIIVKASYSLAAALGSAFGIYWWTGDSVPRCKFRSSNRLFYCFHKVVMSLFKLFFFSQIRSTFSRTL